MPISCPRLMTCRVSLHPKPQMMLKAVSAAVLPPTSAGTRSISLTRRFTLCVLDLRMFHIETETGAGGPAVRAISDLTYQVASSWKPDNLKLGGVR